MHEHAKAKNKRYKQFILHSYSSFQLSFPPLSFFGFDFKAIKYLTLRFGFCFLSWVVLEMPLIIQWTCDNGLQVGVLAVWDFFFSFLKPVVCFLVLKEVRRMKDTQQDSKILTCLDKYKCRACKI